MTTDDPAPAIPELITPEIAEEYLKANRVNRQVRQKALLKYRTAMAAGEWMLNGESIKFDSAGYLTDGQHRLLACVKAGVPFETYVVRGLEPRSRLTLDGGARRTFSDDLQMNGVASARHKSALLRKIMHWEAHHGMAGFTKFDPSRAVQAKRWPEYQAVMDECVSASNRYRKVPANTGIVAFVWWLLVHDRGCDPRLAGRFFSILAIGSQDPADRVLLRLRELFQKWEYASKGAGKRERGPHAEVYWLLRAWNAWVRGENITKWQTPSEGFTNPYPKILHAELEDDTE